jgi:hypothetical protein
VDFGFSSLPFGPLEEDCARANIPNGENSNNEEDLCQGEIELYNYNYYYNYLDLKEEGIF